MQKNTSSKNIMSERKKSHCFDFLVNYWSDFVLSGPLVCVVYMAINNDVMSDILCGTVVLNLYNDWSDENKF